MMTNMPTFPKGKKRPWIPTRDRKTLDNNGTRATKEFISFYNSKRWRSLRRYYIQMNPLCEECLRFDYTTPGECVDHIIPMRDGGKMTSLDNLQTLCNSCHATKSGKEAYIIRKKKQEIKKNYSKE